MSDLRKMKVTVHGVKELWSRGPFKIIEYDTEHESFDGERTIPFQWMSFERGEAVAVVLYKSDTREVVIVRQFRAPTLHLGRDGRPLSPDSGFINETIAGMPLKDPHESFEECAVREIYEEAGYTVKQGELEKISKFYASPGGTSEVIHLYFAIVTEANRDTDWDITKVGSGPEEDTLPLHLPLSEFLDDPKDGDVEDSKLLIARLLLRERLRSMPGDEKDVATADRVRFAVDDGPFEIILRPGNIDQVRDVQVWVNPENTDMQMDRFSGGSVSAVIRYLGASKFPNGDIQQDDIADDLTRKRRGVRQSNIGTAHMTTSGALKSTHKVDKVFHVATVESLPGVQAYQPSARPQQVRVATQKVLEKIHAESQRLMLKDYASALLPMLGAGDQGLPVEAAFPEILAGSLDFIDANKGSKLRQIHLSAFTSNDAQLATEILEQHPRLRRS